MIVIQYFKTCDVCRLVDFNTEKKLCSWCSLCDAWICDDDQHKWGRRFKAAALRKLEPGYAGINNYEEVALRK